MGGSTRSFTIDNVVVTNSYYVADIISAQDYYPYGSLMPGRQVTTNAYRFGYNGMLKDDEMYNSTGTSYNTYFRQHDPRLGRWFSPDPVFQPWQSPYTSMDNNPMMLVDPLGNSTVGQIINKILNKTSGGIRKYGRASSSGLLQRSLSILTSNVGQKSTNFRNTYGRAAIPAGWPPEWWRSNVIKWYQLRNEWNELSTKEKNIVRWDPQFYKVFYIETNADAATTMTKTIFSGNGKGDKSDAFRHAYWQALNTQDVGVEFTEKWSDAHEYSTPSNEVTNHLYMDIHNNNVGIEVGKNNPDATPDELKMLILDKIKNGELLIINSNHKLTKSHGGIIKNNSEIRRYNTSNKIAIEILNNPHGQKTKDYE